MYSRTRVYHALSTGRAASVVYTVVDCVCAAGRVGYVFRNKCAYYYDSVGSRPNHWRYFRLICADVYDMVYSRESAPE